MLHIAVLGYGIVGSGVVEVIQTNHSIIQKKIGKELNVKYVLDLRDFPNDPIQEKIVHDYDIILNDEEVQIIAEAMGGVEPAYTFVKKALQKGKSVATSNKELVAKHGAELLKIAEQKQINFFFEASVGGGIPIIRPLCLSLAQEEIKEISGILNGTTNYILSKMENEGLAFDTVLRDAQSKGYAEANPEADVEGYDACRKIAILTSLAYGQQVDFEDIYTEGITKITDIDIKYAKKLGAVIKLFGSSKKVDDKIYVMVSPVMIDHKHPLYSVNDVFNGILVKGNMLGDIMFYGSGAGKLPTASAVVADIVEAAKHLHDNIQVHWSQEKLMLSNIEDSSRKFFVRLDKAEQINITSLFGGKIKEIKIEEKPNELAFLTDIITEKEFNEAIKELELQGVQLNSKIRVEF